MPSNKFYIKAFDDYHEIEKRGKFKALELGCFYEDKFNYSRYFGLFYTGRLPAFKRIFNSLSKKMVMVNKKEAYIQLERGFETVIKFRKNLKGINE